MTSSDRSMESSANKSPVKIAVFTESANGSGDLIFAVRLARNLQKQYPNAKVEIIAMKDEDEKKLEGFLKSLNMQEIEIKKPSQFKADDYAVAVLGPGVVSIESVKGKFVNTHVILTSQYDNRQHYDALKKAMQNVPCKRFDEVPAGSGSSGILLEENLLPQTHANDFYVAKETDWNGLSNTFLKEKLLSGTNQKDYAQDRYLSLAYCSSLPCGFVPTLHAAYANKFDIPKMDLVMITTNENSKLLQNAKKEFEAEYKEALTKQGFNKISFINIDTHETTVDYDQSNGKLVKEFRLFYGRGVPLHDMMALNKLTANHFCTVAGDQSTTEAISKGCIFNILLLGAYWQAEFIQGLADSAKEKGYLELESVLSSYLQPNTILNNPQSLIDQITDTVQKQFIEFCKDWRSDFQLIDAMVYIMHKENPELKPKIPPKLPECPRDKVYFSDPNNNEHLANFLGVKPNGKTMFEIIDLANDLTSKSETNSKYKTDLINLISEFRDEQINELEFLSQLKQYIAIHKTAGDSFLNYSSISKSCVEKLANLSHLEKFVNAFEENMKLMVLEKSVNVISPD